MPSKPWPKDQSKYVSFEKLADPIRKAIEFAYEIKRKHVHRGIPWSGYDIGRDAKATCFSPHEALGKKCLDFNLEDQDRDVLDTIIQVAVQLGIEQGRRVERGDIRDRMLLAEISLDSLRGFFADLRIRVGKTTP